MPLAPVIAAWPAYWRVCCAILTADAMIICVRRLTPAQVPVCPLARSLCLWSFGIGCLAKFASASEFFFRLPRGLPRAVREKVHQSLRQPLEAARERGCDETDVAAFLRVFEHDVV